MLTKQQYAELAHQANLQGKVLVKDGDNYHLEDPPEPTEEEKTEMLKQEAVAMLNKAALKQAAETAILSDAEIAVIAKAGYYDEWAPDTEYKAGKRLTRDSGVYEVQTDHVSKAHQPPEAAGMLAVYRPVSVDAGGNEPDGTLEKPVPYVYGMDVYNGKYYSYNDAVYLAKADMKPCVWPPDTVGMWQWEEKATQMKFT